MTFVVTRLCIDCVDTSCVAVCPVDCFYQPKEVSEKYPNQLYISPDECIDCAVCEPECPWDAIYADEDVPEVFAEDTVLNAASDSDRDAFALAEVVELEPPTPERVEENKRKWGLV